MKGNDFTLRQLNYSDIDHIMKVEQIVWNLEWQASIDKINSRLDVFPEGCIGIFSNIGELAGFTTSMMKNMINDEYKNNYSWDEITSNGYILNHNNDGNSLYILSVSVLPIFQNSGLGRRLVEAQINLAKSKRLDIVYLGARLPGLREYIENLYTTQKIENINLHIQVKKYVETMRDDGMFIDKELRFYGSYCNFKIVNIIANFGPDYKSMNYGVIMFFKLKS